MTLMDCKCGGIPLTRSLTFGWNIYCPECGISASAFTFEKATKKWNKLVS